MEPICIHCGELVEDWEPIFCCNGYMCGCMGQPIDPPEHEICAAIFMLKRVQETEEKSKKFRLAASTDTSGKTKLYNGRKVISNDDITRKEAFHITDLSGTMHCMSSWVDFIVEKLKTIEK